MRTTQCLPRKGVYGHYPERDRGPGTGQPHGKGPVYPGLLSAVAERLDQCLQPEIEPRSGDFL